MTVDEAVAIRRQVSTGALNLELPGTREVVLEAERTCASADLWGRTPEDKRRSRIAVAVIAATTLLITAIALVPFTPQF